MENLLSFFVPVAGEISLVGADVAIQKRSDECIRDMMCIRTIEAIIVPSLYQHLVIAASCPTPSDNLFFNTSGAKKEIWAYGLRNPFTFGFKPGTSTMYINDVGQDAWEEINKGSSGANLAGLRSVCQPADRNTHRNDSYKPIPFKGG